MINHIFIKWFKEFFGQCTPYAVYKFLSNSWKLLAIYDITVCNFANIQANGTHFPVMRFQVPSITRATQYVQTVDFFALPLQEGTPVGKPCLYCSSLARHKKGFPCRHAVNVLLLLQRIQIWTPDLLSLLKIARNSDLLLHNFIHPYKHKDSTEWEKFAYQCRPEKNSHTAARMMNLTVTNAESALKRQKKMQNANSLAMFRIL